MTSELIYTDGACSDNGKSNSAGGFGIYIATSALFGGPCKINKRGETMTFRDHTLLVTNIRMEGLAILSTLQLYSSVLILNPITPPPNPISILNESTSFDAEELTCRYGDSELKVLLPVRDTTIEIVTDSLFWMKVIDEWMPKWIQKNILLDKKNPDILLLLLYYTELLKQNGVAVIYTHVKSHQRRNRTHHADGNDVADVLATSAVKNTNTAFTAI